MSPTSNQPANQAQFMAVMPVNKYKQVTSPSSGIKDQFLKNAPSASTIQMIQKIIEEILNVSSASVPLK